MATSRVKFRIKSYTFKAVIEPDQFADGRAAYHAYIPALQGCRTWGYTVQEALENLEVAAKMILDLMLERGEPIPEEIQTREEPLITVNVAS
jgi:antitoxin HicB